MCVLLKQDETTNLEDLGSQGELKGKAHPEFQLLGTQLSTYFSKKRTRTETGIKLKSILVCRLLTMRIIG